VDSNVPRVSLRANGVDVSELTVVDHSARRPGSALRPGANQVELAGTGADRTLLANDSLVGTRQ